jgi:hypothetical protein
MFAGLLTEDTQHNVKNALRDIMAMPDDQNGDRPGRHAAEHSDYLESLIAHPQMLTLARRILGEDIRYDHCVALVLNVLEMPSGRVNTGNYQVHCETLPTIA